MTDDENHQPETVRRPRQLWLLARVNPLVERFGNRFFRTLPRSPGVYLMHGLGGRPRRHRILYVGKARDLRQRLGSYRHVHPERDSRKTIRLVHAVEQITWEECADETAALLRENALLREHRPLFNRMNVRPEAHGYVGIAAAGRSLALILAAKPGEEGEWHGAFKGTRRLAAAALLRLLYQTQKSLCEWTELPHRLVAERTPKECQLQMDNLPGLPGLLTDYFRGRSWKLIEWIAGQIGTESVPPFLESWRRADLELLQGFYLMGPRRNHRWRLELGLGEDALFRPEELDDLPVKVRLTHETSPWEGEASRELHPVSGKQTRDLFKTAAAPSS
ncbi:MAG TPA: hypothetical protein DCY13_07625 [Verrucomicrobiales bacterium]|nr:hypothetical protein [Verrucomicrobiales bacterium]